jgi:hypothetical protein
MLNGSDLRKKIYVNYGIADVQRFLEKYEKIMTVLAEHT